MLGWNNFLLILHRTLVKKVCDYIMFIEHIAYIHIHILYILSILFIYIYISYPFFPHFSQTGASLLFLCSNNRNENQILIMHFLAATKLWPNCGLNFLGCHSNSGNSSNNTSRNNKRHLWSVLRPEGIFICEILFALVVAFHLFSKNISARCV